MLLGFLINPIAGMGGKVALKGTDGVVDEAIRRGAKEVAIDRARKFVKGLEGEDIIFLTPLGKMGEDALKDYNIKYRVIYNTPENTTAEDTKNVCRIFLQENVNLLVFVGGDGTARDVVEVINSKIPVLGIPSGVKMYSSVFSISPEKGSEIVKAFVRGDANLKDSEILDIDEEKYRKNELSIKLFGFARTPYIRDFVQASKSEYGGEEEEEAKEDIADFVVENMESDTLYLLGAGTTVAKIAEILGVEKTLLGVDALYNGKIIGGDLAEKDILSLIEKYSKVKLIVTPIGSQGFIFGRGNQQISGRVLKKIGKENIIVIATPKKLMSLEKLRVDIDDGDFLRGYQKVLYGYGRYKLMKVE
ncbi:MAG: ATP-NAD kinase family protein [Thermoplasmata archaeon]|nr:ATP-NAD kinase family protein [Thermoplasmata archaeon]